MENKLFNYKEVLIFLVILLGVYLTSFYNYLLFHSLAEVFSVVIATGIFMIAWNARVFIENDYLIFIGIAYIFIAGIDFVHTLAYKGMNIFHGFDANLPTQLWIIARYFQAITLLIAPIFFYRKLKHTYIIPFYTLITLFLLGSVLYWNIFPTAYVEGVGLTTFKIVSEYIISIILLGAIFFLYKNKENLDKSVFKLLVASIIFTIGSELAFTFYVGVYGFSNMVGHFFKIIAFYLIYKAIVQVGLTKPYNLLFSRTGKGNHRRNNKSEDINTK
jgi:hypothetical protein